MYFLKQGVLYNSWQERKYVEFRISQGKLETAEPPNQVTVAVCPRKETARAPQEGKRVL